MDKLIAALAGERAEMDGEELEEFVFGQAGALALDAFVGMQAASRVLEQAKRTALHAQMSASVIPGNGEQQARIGRLAEEISNLYSQVQDAVEDIGKEKTAPGY